MERLTERKGNSVIYSEFNRNSTDSCYEMMNNCLHKLADYEDAEEKGLLLRLPCKRVYYIVDKRTKYATVMSKSIQDLRVFEIKGIDKDGYYWSTQEQAEQKLKETESE